MYKYVSMTPCEYYSITASLEISVIVVTIKNRSKGANKKKISTDRTNLLMKYAILKK